MIEQVEELASEFQVVSLANSKMLVHQKIDRRASGSDHRVAAKAAECSQSLRNKHTWIEPHLRRPRLRACRNRSGSRRARLRTDRERASLRDTFRGIVACSDSEIRSIREVGAAGL